MTTFRQNQCSRCRGNRDHGEPEYALNALGYRNWLGKPYNAKRVSNLRLQAGLKSRFRRLRAQGFVTAREIAQQLGMCRENAYKLGREGVLHSSTMAGVTGASSLR